MPNGAVVGAAFRVLMSGASSTGALKALYPFNVTGAEVTTLPVNDPLDVFRQGLREQWARLR